MVTSGSLLWFINRVFQAQFPRLVLRRPPPPIQSIKWVWLINLVQTVAPDWVIEALDLNIIPAVTAMSTSTISAVGRFLALPPICNTCRAVFVILSFPFSFCLFLCPFFGLFLWPLFVFSFVRLYFPLSLFVFSFDIFLSSLPLPLKKFNAGIQTTSIKNIRIFLSLSFCCWRSRVRSRVALKWRLCGQIPWEPY